jgi:hypothetical protein
VTDLDATTTTPPIIITSPGPDPGPENILGPSAPLNTIVSNDNVNRVAVVQLRNTSDQACAISGHPSLAMLKGSNSLPTRTRRVGPGNGKIIAPPQGTAAILIGHYNTPTGNGTRCNTSTNLLVALPGMGHLNVPAKIKACNDGLLYTSPVLDDVEFGRSGDTNVGAFNSGTGNTGFSSQRDATAG